MNARQGKAVFCWLAWMKGTDEPTTMGLHRCLALIKGELRDVSNGIETMALGPDLDHCLFTI